MTITGKAVGRWARAKYLFGMMWLGIMIMGALAFSAPAIGQQFREDFERGLSAQWKKVEFEGETQYIIEKEGTNSVLRGTAKNAATGLAVKFDGLAPRGGNSFVEMENR